MTDAKANGALDLADLDALDTAELEIRHPATGEPIGWRITFAGPGHPQTIAFNNRVHVRRQREALEKERAQINGRKWKGEEKSLDAIRAENLAWVVDRIVDWTPLKVNGKDVPFSCESAMRVFGDPRKEKLLLQCIEFLADEQTFFRRSATT